MTHRTKYPPGGYNPRIPRPNARGPRPQTWVTGPDPVEHRRYRIFIQQRNQAQWREEGWTISFEDWKQIWDQSGQWHNRGRERGCYCMTRKDVYEPWTPENVHVITREEHALQQGQLVKQGYRSLAQTRHRERLGRPVERKRPGKKS